MRIDLPDLASVDAFASRIADKLMVGDVIALSGNLGAGKSTLARSILHALGHTGEVPSPTFTIIEVYDSPSMRLPAVHADFYRLEDPQEAVELGLDDYRDGNVLIAEWPEKAGGFDSEPQCLSIEIEFADEGRSVIARGGPAWLERMP